MNNWRDIEGYEGIYWINRLGKVKSKSRIMKCFNNGSGYRYITLMRDSKRKNKYIHRLVATAFISNPAAKPQVNHIDCDKANNKVDNLEWVTPKGNMKHARENNRMNLGRINKVKPNQVLQIREKNNMGFTRKQLCEEYNLSPAQICRIVTYQNWKNI